MSGFRRWLVVLVILLVETALLAVSVRADYVLATFPGGIARVSNTGKFVRQFLLYDYYYGGYSEFIGESVDGLTLGPDGYVYAVTNDLGQGAIHRFDPKTGLGETFRPWDPFPPDTTLEPNFTIPGAISFGPHGDLYAVSMDWGPLINRGDGVFRFDSQTADIVELLPGASGALQSYVRFSDVESRAGGDPLYDGELFVAVANGVLQRHHQIAAIPPMSPYSFESIDTTIDGMYKVAFGPDGLLYIRELVNDSVIRYDVDAETIVDAFVAAPEAEGVGDLLFGPNGELILVNRGEKGVGHLARFDGSTGEFLGSIFPELPDEFLGVTTYLEPSVIYLPIPEPSTLVLLFVYFTAATLIRLRKRAQSPR